MNTGQFNLSERGMQSKQFGLNAEETLKFADWDKKAVAVVETKIPTEILKEISDFTPVDTGIFKSGNVTIHSEVLDRFNQSILGITEKY